MPDRKETPGWSNLTSIRRQKIPSGSSSTTSTYQVLRARLSRVAGFDSANRTHERAGRLDSPSRDGILVLKTDGLGPPGGNHHAWLRPGLDMSRGGTQKRRASLAGSWNTQRHLRETRANHSSRRPYRIFAEVVLYLFIAISYRHAYTGMTDD